MGVGVLQSTETKAWMAQAYKYAVYFSLNISGNAMSAFNLKKIAWGPYHTPLRPCRLPGIQDQLWKYCVAVFGFLKGAGNFFSMATPFYDAIIWNITFNNEQQMTRHKKPHCDLLCWLFMLWTEDWLVGNSEELRFEWVPYWFETSEAMNYTNRKAGKENENKSREGVSIYIQQPKLFWLNEHYERKVLFEINGMYRNDLKGF